MKRGSLTGEEAVLPALTLGFCRGATTRGRNSHFHPFKQLYAFFFSLDLLDISYEKLAKVLLALVLPRRLSNCALHDLETARIVLH